MAKGKTLVIIFGIMIIAFLLRWYLMPSHFFFGPEQGRDLLVVRDIVESHKLTLIGPRTDVDNLFHGPMFYYLEALPYMLFRGDPVAVFMFFVAIQTIGVVVAYQFVYELSKSKRGGFIAALLYAVSFFGIVYSRWLSHPPLALPLSLLFMLCLLRFIKGNPQYLVWSAFIYGLLGQTDFVNYLVFGAIGASILAIYWKRFARTSPIMLCTAVAVGFITSFGTYLVFDVRHNFLNVQGVIDLLIQKKGVSYTLDYWTSITHTLRILMDSASQVFGLFGWVNGVVVTIPLLAVLFLHVRKNNAYYLLVAWVCAPPILFALLRRDTLIHFYSGVIISFVVLAALFIEWLWKKWALAGMGVLLLVIGINVYGVFRYFPTNSRVFFQVEQPAVRYTDQIAVIDWIYAQADSRPFEFQAFTIPYFLQAAWIYLFDTYGTATYGYGPTAVNRKLLYVIIQNNTIDPVFQRGWYQDTVSTWGKKTDSVIIGEYIVEERVSP